MRWEKLDDNVKLKVITIFQFNNDVKLDLIKRADNSFDFEVVNDQENDSTAFILPGEIAKRMAHLIIEETKNLNDRFVERTEEKKKGFYYCLCCNDHYCNRLVNNMCVKCYKKYIEVLSKLIQLEQRC